LCYKKVTIVTHFTFFFFLLTALILGAKLKHMKKLAYNEPFILTIGYSNREADKIEQILINSEIPFERESCKNAPAIVNFNICLKGMYLMEHLFRILHSN